MQYNGAIRVSDKPQSIYNVFMETGTKTPAIILIVSVAILAGAVGFWFAQSSGRSEAAQHEQTLTQIGPLLGLPEPKILDEFSLYDHTGGEFNQSSLQGSWTLVFFGFTSCPHICPNTLFKLKTVVELLEGQLPEEQLPQVMLISVDPDRDTAEVLDQYRERFGDTIITVSGEHEQLRAVAMDFGAHYVIPEHEAGEWYNVDHSISVHLLNPDAKWAGLLSAPHEVEAMAEALKTYIGDS